MPIAVSKNRLHLEIARSFRITHMVLNILVISTSDPHRRHDTARDTAVPLLIILVIVAILRDRRHRTLIVGTHVRSVSLDRHDELDIAMIRLPLSSLSRLCHALPWY